MKESKTRSKENVHNVQWAFCCWLYFQLAGAAMEILDFPAKPAGSSIQKQRGGQEDKETKAHLQQMVEFREQMGTWDPDRLDSQCLKKIYF